MNINISSGEKYHLKFDDWEKLDFLSGESSDPLLEVRVERETFNMLTRGRNSLEDLKRIYIEALRDGRIKVDGHGVKGWMAKKALEKLPGML
ncbi:MAG: hypothetical protein DRO11_08125 [Methanobacteriota archaeon]|nr:MAG: hypothetical protein DRO11_08125 [Euryarchaeota archaeon]